ncbi:ABC transporter substrate-binding protein [Streptomyces sp. NPDC090493]|uniref:ABC transporter substrate-binding protein n=1 Tax=Streptomyces sp. NPDC090493 TaxID=3365964 RepID=UPI00380D78E8
MHWGRIFKQHKRVPEKRGDGIAGVTGARRRLAAALALACLFASAACGGSGNGAGSGASDTLVVGMAETTASMNPALCPLTAYQYFAYDPVIYQKPDGSYAPDLATSWGYVGKGNKSFEFTLRKDAKFADGTALTAAAAKASLEYFLKAKGPNLSLAGPISKISAVDEYTVRIDYKKAFPSAVASLSQDSSFGYLIGPKGVADPKSLESTSDGVGHYTLTAQQTTADSVYTFLPDKHYFNQDAITYKKVQLKPYASQSAELKALQSGQIQYAQNVASVNAGAVKSAKMNLSAGGTRWSGLVVEDWDSAPLNNVKVRQAIQYAINRPQIVKAVYSGYATAKYQIADKGTVGYLDSEQTRYSYDPDKAKQLLAEAGYADGVTLSLIDATQFDANGVLAQALADQLSKVGITLKLHVVAGNFSVYLQQLNSKKYQTAVGGANTGETYYATTSLMASSAFPFTDATAENLLAKAAAADKSHQAAAMEAVNRYFDEQSWFIPVATMRTLQVTAPSVKNVPATFATTDINPVSPVTEDNWSPAS